MSYHDRHFARRAGETPLRPNYANWIEGPEKHEIGTNVLWYGVVVLSVVLVLGFVSGVLSNV
jgi:hypothetical protein